MDDKDSLDVTDTSVLNAHLTSKNRLLMEEITEGEGTTVRHRYQPKAARVSSARRLLNWLMNRIGESDL